MKFEFRFVNDNEKYTQQWSVDFAKTGDLDLGSQAFSLQPEDAEEIQAEGEMKDGFTLIAWVQSDGDTGRTGLKGECRQNIWHFTELERPSCNAWQWDVDQAEDDEVTVTLRCNM